MFDPSGPLPPSVYWRRRAGAVVSTVVAVVVLAWIIGSLVGPDDSGTPNMAGMLAPKTSRSPSSPPSTTRYTKVNGSTTARPTTSTRKPRSQPPLKCSDAAITVTAQVGAKRYQVGQRPLLKIVIGNAGQVACTRDISRKLRELVVISGDGVHRLWSSNDCVTPTPDKDVRLLKPGDKLSFSITWAGRTSAHGCPAGRETLEAGKYLVVAKLGKISSHPITLRLTG